MTSRSRELDVLVVGATGYTGKIVVTALASSSLKYGVCGRNKDKLAAVAPKGAKNLPAAVIVVDLAKQDDLRAAVRRAVLVIACAGPFAAVGMPVVDACVAEKTHYIDITGEVPFIRVVVEKHHKAAAEAGIFVIPCSGFDCVASDMANYYAHKLAEGRGKKLAAIEAGFKVKGGPSRGTIESSMHFVQTATKEDLHPLCLVPRGDRKAQKLPPVLPSAVSFHADFKQYRGPFVMAVVNERVVRRSDYLSGRTGAYSEMLLGTWGACRKAQVSQLAFVAMKYSLGRALLRRYVFPPEGGGPSEAEKARSSFSVHVLGRNAEAKPTVACAMTYPRDAYSFTGMAAVEVASAIVADEVNSGAKHGVVTPAYAVGDALIRRLGDKGVKFRSKL